MRKITFFIALIVLMSYFSYSQQSKGVYTGWWLVTVDKDGKKVKQLANVSFENQEYYLTTYENSDLYKINPKTFDVCVKKQNFTIMGIKEYIDIERDRKLYKRELKNLKKNLVKINNNKSLCEN